MRYLALNVALIVTLMIGVSLSDAANPPEGIAFPQYGISLKGPVGWAGRFEPGKDHVVGWDHFDPDDHNLRAAIVLRATTAQGRTLNQFAAAAAKDFGGRVADRNLIIDGAPCYRIDADQGQPGLHLRTAVVTLHSNVCYTLLVASILNEPLDDTLTDLLGNWRWMPVSSPADHSTYLPGVRLLGDVVALPLPTGMGLPNPAGNWNDPGVTSVALELPNLRTGRDDVRLTVSIHDARSGETPDTLRARLLDPLRQRAKQPQLNWRQDPDRPIRHTTPFVSADPPRGNVSSGERLATIETADGRLVLLTFQILTLVDKDRAVYERQFDYMFNELVLFHRPKAKTGSP